MSTHNGNMVAASGTASTSATTGAAVVVGGIGVSGNIYVDRVYTTNGLYWAGNGYVMSTGGGGSATAGLAGQVQYNSGGSLGASNIYYFSGNSSAAVVGGIASTSTTTGQLQVVGGVGITGDTFIGGNLSVVGQSVSIGASTLSITDPVINLNTPSDLTPLTITTTSDIGLKFHYYLGSDRHAFLGRAVDSSFLEYYADGNDTANVFTGTSYGTIKGGEFVAANSTASTSTTTGALRVAGGAGIAGAVYAGSVYDNGNRVLTSLSSSGAGNLTVSVSAPASTTVALPATGPGATTVGSSTSIPVITTDAYGRISALTSSAVSTTISLAGTTGTGSVAGGGTLTFSGSNGFTATVSGSTITLSDPQDLRTSASPTFAGLTVNGTTTRSSKSLITNYTGSSAPSSPQQGDEWYKSGSDILYKYVYDGTGYSWVDLTSPLYNANVGAIANTLALRDSSGNLTATNFIGIASSAKYADLAEIYVPDQTYEAATVVVFGGTHEITVSDISHDSRVAGVVSTNPAYLMNSECEGLPIAFTGRVPCRVKGPVSKGQLLVTSTTAGVAQALVNTQFVPGCVIGKSLENITTNEIATIEVVVGRF